MVTEEPLAHSARTPDSLPQKYQSHIAGTLSTEGVVNGARQRATSMIRYHQDKVSRQAIATAVVDAATFHDLGKLDPLTQKELCGGRGTKLTWDHVDAGVAHLMAHGARMAAWLVRAHHAPGLPSSPFHFTDKRDRRL